MDFFGYSAIMEQFERVYRESNLADKKWVFFSRSKEVGNFNFSLATIEGEQADPRLNLFTLKCRLTELLDISSFRLERGKHSVSLMGHMAEKKVGEMALKHSWSQGFYFSEKTENLKTF